MEPAESLSEKPVLDESERKNEEIILEHHAMLTPSDYTFSVLHSTTRNFQFRGNLWLTDHRLIYKGFLITKMGASIVSENLMKPYCEIDTNQPFNVIIPIDEIFDIFIGHDNTFQKRFQHYPKLRIQFKSDNKNKIYYFYLIRENLIDDEVYINIRCQEWKDKITELRSKLVSVEAPQTPAKPVAQTASTSPVTIKAPERGTDKLLEEVMASVDAKRFRKIVVNPLEERPKPEFKALANPMEFEVGDDEMFAKVLDTLIPGSDEEFIAATADTSIAKCPHCGWILSYATSKCPRCRKEI